MANLHIGEYSDIGSTSRGSIPIPLEPPRKEHSLEITAESKQSDALSDDTCIVTLISDANCVIAIGADPDATNSVRLLSAGQEKIITVAQGSRLKIAVAGKGSGSMHDSLGAFLTVVADPVEAKKNLDALTAQASTVEESAKKLRDAADEHRKSKKDLDVATASAKDALANSHDGIRSLATQRKQFEADKAAHEAQRKSDADVAAARDARATTAEAVTAAAATAAEAKASETRGAANALDARDRALAEREAAVTHAKQDYEARLAKLKALTA